MSRLSVIQGDITKLNVDVIVNAANEQLLPGGGVCGAIFRAAGAQLLNECRKIGFCKTGNAVITYGYMLPAKRIIHAVGPKYFEDPGRAQGLLASAYIQSLMLAAEEKLESLAFPCISTGIYGFPKNEAAQIAVDVCLEFGAEYPKKITFCCFEDEDVRIYETLLKRNFL